MSRLSPLNRRRLRNFRANRRAFWSLWIFLALFVVSLAAELVANDRPFLVKFQGGYLSPLLQGYPETRFGGDLLTPADYHDPFVQELIRTNGDEALAEGESPGWILWPPIPF
ncbi:MAG: ABC transporter permease, partial [Paracoccaceae bacterium]